MSVKLFQVAVRSDSMLPRDVIVNTFHLASVSWDVALTGNLDSICHDAAQAFADHWYGQSREIGCKAYDVDGAPPHFPIGQAVIHAGLAPPSAGPREVALCLSYFGTRNLPRTRGRMYLAVGPSSQTQMNVRPGTGQLDAALTLGAAIGSLGGADVDWNVYSHVDGHHETVTRYYCDNEWDTQRRRGLVADDRHMAASSG